MVGYETLSHVVEDILELPRDCRKGKGHRAVKAIFSVLIAALLRGETVNILGFGTFSLHNTRTKPRKLCVLAGNLFPTNPRLYQEVVIHPGRTTVVFKPSKVLRSLVNESFEKEEGQKDYAQSQP